MRNELQVFKNEEFGEIRTVLIDEAPYFVGVDIAKSLGYSNTTDAIKRVEPRHRMYLNKQQLVILLTLPTRRTKT